MKLLGLLIMVPLLGGCATSYFASAPAASPDRMYVVGNANGEHAIWLCPVTGSDAECTRVDIEE